LEKINTYFFSSTHNDNAFWIMTTALPCIHSFTLNPGGIRTRDLLFCRRTRWPLHHPARFETFAILQLCDFPLFRIYVWQTFMGCLVELNKKTNPRKQKS
jgi:hypothetical protein